MPVKPRLFFSHSTNADPTARQILLDIAAGVENRFAVLLDRQCLKLGSDWRSTINFWIETCNAAVILVTPDSIESEYCQYEWSLLSYRHRHRKDCLIVPIFYKSTIDDIKGKPHQIGEISAAKVYDNALDVIAHIVAELATVPAPDEPGRKQLLYISDILKQAIAMPERLNLAAARINLDTGAWDLTQDRWQAFALKLMGIGLNDAALVLDDLKGYFKGDRRSDLKDILDLIAWCSWVDVGSAERIRDRAERGDARLDAIGINIGNSETTRCYVLRGSERAPPSESWPIGFAGTVYGPDPNDLVAEVEKALREAFKLPRDADAAAIKRKLDAYKHFKKPVFIVLRAEGLTLARIESLCALDQFAWVNFLIMSGDSDVRGLLRDEQWLAPPLPRKLENELWENYDLITAGLDLEQV